MRSTGTAHIHIAASKLTKEVSICLLQNIILTLLLSKITILCPNWQKKANSNLSVSEKTHKFALVKHSKGD
jgi:hypothetical protein